MNEAKTQIQPLRTSILADELMGSEIIKLAAEIRAKIAAGNKIYNYTIGDFNPEIFPIPQVLEERITQAYKAKQTNYPPSNGILELRENLSNFIKKKQGLDYSPTEFLVSAGGRPLIHAIYQTIVDPSDHVIFPVPSWNNNHYTSLTRSQAITIATQAENNFMPTAAEIEPHITKASLIALCSPLNPTGTVFSKSELGKICTLVVEENKRRDGKRKPLYLLYDQIYWQICFGQTVHHDPVSVMPEMRPYTIYVDGISKAFSATGVRVGWAFGPENIIRKMATLLGHIGAWSPKPEQVATARFLKDTPAVDAFMKDFKIALNMRLEKFYDAFTSMREQGLPVDAIAPQAAMYLTVKIDLIGKTKPDGQSIQSIPDTTAYLLDAAGLALVPFTSFGAPDGNPWYRLSVGTTKAEDIPVVVDNLRNAIKRLK